GRLLRTSVRTSATVDVSRSQRIAISRASASVSVGVDLRAIGDLLTNSEFSVPTLDPPRRRVNERIKSSPAAMGSRPIDCNLTVEERCVAESARRWTLEVPARTIVKLLAVAGLIWAWLLIWQLVLLLLLAVVLAVALDPATSWLERRGLPRGSSAALIILGLVAVVTGFALLAGSSLLSEGRLVSARL